MKRFILLTCIALSFFIVARELGIKGQAAPELSKLIWYDKNEKKIEPIKIGDFKDKVIYLHFFQSWCPGCLSSGLPTIKHVSKVFNSNEKIKIFAIQTVFEGFGTNTKEKALAIKRRFKLDFPVGHDDGKLENAKASVVMKKYRAGGTPWTVIINKKGKVIYNDFHISKEKAVSIINSSL